MTKAEIKIKCDDNYELAGTIYKPTNIIGAIMIAPATGIKRRFYNAFATHLAKNGYGVICFENRGIGDSKKGDINKVNASLINWGKLDMPAVLNQLKLNFPNQSYHLIGHSAGGQLVGLMYNASELSSLFNFAASSGSLRNMVNPFKLKALFFMNVFIPLNNLLFGKTNSQWVGMGEPLPKLAAKQWQKWCNGQGYVETDFGENIKTHLYDILSFPSLWLHATDDHIANLKNVQDMARVYSKSESRIISLDPQKNGYDQLGHMSFFSSKKQALWHHAIDWLHEN